VALGPGPRTVGGDYAEAATFQRLREQPAHLSARTAASWSRNRSGGFWNPSESSEDTSPGLLDTRGPRD